MAETGSPYTYTVADAAVELGMCKRTLEGWIRAGHLRVFRFGRTRRIRRAWLDAFVERFARGGEPTIAEQLVPLDDDDIPEDTLNDLCQLHHH